MSNFKTKKLTHTKIKEIHETDSIAPTPSNPKKKIRKVIAVVLVLLGFIFGINYIVQGIGNMRIGTAGDNSTWVPPIFEETGSTISSVKKWNTNILIVGIGGADHQGGSLADSIMLASFNEEKKSISMISIPRDLYVSYGSGKSAGKINSLYPIGISRKEWISLLANKVSEITGESIHHYMAIDFTAFRYIVNALGGIEIEVEKDLYDKEYPDYNYGYTIFSVKKWLQNFNGETALRYARSRHSTNDMDRSHRQQQIINAIKTKSLSLGIITNPTKISEIIDATRRNINTDLTVWDIISLGSSFAGVSKWDINVYNIGDNCISYNNCTVWAYLYSPSMAYFGWAWSLIPEWAKINRLSYYDRIHKFVNFVFDFPGLHKVVQPIVVVYTTASSTYARNLLMEMRKIGINYDASHVLKAATGAIEQSHINVYWNNEYSIGINPKSDIMNALKSLDIHIPINIVTSNEYVKTDGPKIEIILGNDYKEFFTFADPVSYLPKIISSWLSGTTVSGEKKQTPIKGIAPEKKQSSGSLLPSIESKKPTSKPPSSNSWLPVPGEWENL